MSVYDFPDTSGQPTDGSFEYTAPDGTLYEWNGYAWVVPGNGQSGSAEFVKVVGDNMTGNLTLGTDKIKLDASVGDIQSTSQNSGPLAGFRNQLINGDFRIWQRGTAFSGTLPKYTADRWYAANGIGNVVDVVQSQAEALSFTQGSLLARNDTGSIRQGIELQRNKNDEARNGQFAVGSQWTLSIYASEDLTVLSSSWNFTTEVGVGGVTVPAATTGNWQLIPGTTDGVFNRYSITATITGTTADDSKAFEIILPAANNFAGGSIYYAAVQLEPGPVATPFEQRPIAAELALCQRYYQKIRIGGKQGAAIPKPGSGSKILYSNVTPPVPLRATATVFAYAPSVFNNATGDNTTAVGITEYTAGLSLQMAYKIGVEYDSTSSAANIYGWQVTAEFDVEL